MSIDHFNVDGLPDGSSNFNPNGRATYERIAAQSAERAQRENRLTFSHVFELGAAAVLTALASGDREAQERRLRRLRVVMEKWLESLKPHEATNPGMPAVCPCCAARTTETAFLDLSCSCPEWCPNVTTHAAPRVVLSPKYMGEP